VASALERAQAARLLVQPVVTRVVIRHALPYYLVLQWELGLQKVGMAGEEKQNMAAEPRQRPNNSLTVRSDQMLFAIPVEENGVEETLFTTDDTQPTDERPIKLAGVWSHLD